MLVSIVRAASERDEARSEFEVLMQTQTCISNVNRTRREQPRVEIQSDKESGLKT